ncbi:MAG TPA: ribonuclease D, partial [Dehalococcoidia bacterium]|nr:ribonuclease D [Dehalococcoidia bacterium]
MNVTVVEGDLPAQLADELRASGTVAVDTETSGLDWATDRLWICQLYAPACGAVILRNVVDRAPHFCDLIASEEVLKVFHFAPFDLRFLEAQWHTSPRRIAC